MSDLPDIHAMPPRIRVDVDAVGIKDVLRSVAIEDLVSPALVHIDCSLRVPSEYRGAHISRVPIAIDQAIDSLKGPVNGVRLVRAILDAVERLNPEAGEYAVNLCVDTVMERDNHHGHGYSTMKKPCRLGFAGRRRESDEVRVAAEIKVGMACPQAQASLEAMHREPLAEFLDPESVDLLYKSIAAPSHNQLCEVRLELSGNGDSMAEVAPLDLIPIMESSCSSPTFEYLKRREEGLAVNKMHWHAMFAEDAAREMASAAATTFKDIPDESRVSVSILSYESIYDYALVCRLENSVGALRVAAARP